MDANLKSLDGGLSVNGITSRLDELPLLDRGGSNNNRKLAGAVNTGRIGDHTRGWGHSLDARKRRIMLKSKSRVGGIQRSNNHRQIVSVELGNRSIDNGIRRSSGFSVGRRFNDSINDGIRGVTRNRQSFSRLGNRVKARRRNLS